MSRFAFPAPMAAPPQSEFRPQSHALPVQAGSLQQSKAKKKSRAPAPASAMRSLIPKFSLSAKRPLAPASDMATQRSAPSRVQPERVVEEKISESAKKSVQSRAAVFGAIVSPPTRRSISPKPFKALAALKFMPMREQAEALSVPSKKKTTPSPSSSEEEIEVVDVYESAAEVVVLPEQEMAAEGADLYDRVEIAADRAGLSEEEIEVEDTPHAMLAMSADVYDDFVELGEDDSPETLIPKTMAEARAKQATVIQGTEEEEALKLFDRFPHLLRQNVSCEFHFIIVSVNVSLRSLIDAAFTITYSWN